MAKDEGLQQSSFLAANEFREYLTLQLRKQDPYSFILKQTAVWYNDAAIICPHAFCHRQETSG